MTQEQKQLLLRDLCARLPYGFTVHRYSDNRDITFGKNKLNEFSHFLEYSEGEEFKPYLRSMESMTKEEEKEFNEIIGYKGEDIDGWTRCDNICTMYGIYLSGVSNLIDWLLEHHFDFCGLIPIGLALKAPEGMYKNL